MTWTVDERYPRRVTSAALRAMRIPTALGALVLVLAGLAIFSGDVIEMVIAGVLTCVIFVPVLALRLARFRRRLARLQPPGSVIGACLTADQLWTSGSDGTSQVWYGSYSSVRVLGDMVMLRRRGGISVLYPQELFGPDGLVRVRERIAAAQHARP